MGRIRLVEDRGQKFFAVELVRPGTYSNWDLLDREHLEIAAYLVPGATLSTPKLERFVYTNDVTDDAVERSLLACEAPNALALLATNFSWDDSARREADRLGIDPAEVEAIRRQILPLHEEQVKQSVDLWRRLLELQRQGDEAAVREWMEHMAARTPPWLSKKAE